MFRMVSGWETDSVKRRRLVIVGLYVVLVTLAVAVFGQPFWRSVIAIGAAVVIFLAGYAVISGLAQPTPAPPEPGNLRKVKLVYRCSNCGAEVRMTVAAEEDPEPPRHCMEEMELLTPVE